ncbi:MAG: murein biosynthesis integral membrane protein MurJ [Candidatus Omnitrophica bacterium]|nr:murein biosynthesis integral membrane protein MurJ [Candidatus Omnitrophota bacterium]
MLRKVIRNTTIISLGTLLSRILGFIRDVLMANFFGTSADLESFIVAFRIPNLLRSLFGEGFSESVATPTLSEHSENKREFFKIGNHLISIFIVLLLVATFMGVIFSKFIVIVMAPGFIVNAYKFNLAVLFTRIMFVYLFLIGLETNIESILCALKKFFVTAFSPCIFNIVLILGILLFTNVLNIFVLVWAVITAGILEILFSFIFLKSEGFKLEFNFLEALHNNIIHKMIKLFIPRVWSAVIYHLNVLIDTALSSFSSIVGEGALAAIYYSNRIIQFPLALIALSISRVAIVDFSQFNKDGNLEDFKKLFIFSFESIALFIIPISFFLFFNSKDILRILFLRGNFDNYSLNITSKALFFYSFGLFFFCGIKLLVNTFYSLKDTLTPAKVATFSLIVNALTSALFMFPLKIGGIALGSSISASVNFFILYYILKKRIGVIKLEGFSKEIIKLTILGLGIGSISKIIFRFCMNRYLSLIYVCIISLIIFVFLGTILRLKQFKYLKRWEKLKIN